MNTESIIEALKMMQIPTEGLSENSLLDADLGMDSIELLDFQLTLERQLGISIPSDAFMGHFSIGQICSILHQVSTLANP